MKKYLIILVILLHWSPSIRAQIQGDVAFPVSPQNNNFNMINNSANIGPMANGLISKDLCSGVAAVNIPFYSYSIGNVNINVGLHYIASGIQVDEQASNVGLGWTFDFGPKIQRQIRGALPDEHYKVWGMTPNPPSDFGYWYANGSQRKDNECDVFYLTIGNSNYEFMFAQNGDLLTIPETSKIKIERYINGNPVTGTATPPTESAQNLTFIITDEFGSKYYFDVTDNSDEALLGSDGSIHHADAWYPSKIVTYDNKEIDFDYDVDNYIKDLGISEIWQEKNNNFGAGYFHQDQVLTHEAHIRDIKFPNGITVAFTWQGRCDISQAGSGFDAKGHCLTSVVIKENSPLATFPYVHRSFTLNYSYFHSPDYNTPYSPADYTTWVSTDGSPFQNVATSCTSQATTYLRYRLKLDNISQCGTDWVCKPYFKFDYSTIPLPPRLVGGRDKYGYANGAVALTYHSPSGTACDGAVLILQHYLGSDLVGMSAAPNADYVQGCMLNKITNETGGIATLTYKPISSLGLPGAVDMSSLVVTNVDYNDGFSTNNDQHHRYLYSQYEKSTPMDGSTMTFNGEGWDYCTAAGEGYYYWTYYLFGSNELNTGLNGRRYVFRNVTEKIADNANNQIKATAYQFSGLTANGHGITDNTYSPPNSGFVSFGLPPFSNKQIQRSWGMGLLLAEFTYNQDNILTEQKNYTYNVSSHYQTSNFGGDHTLDYIANHNGSFLKTYPTHDYYYPFSGSTLLTNVQVNGYYNMGSYISKSTDYTYDDRNNLVMEKYYNSKGEPTWNNYFYDYSLSGGAGLSTLNSNGVERVIYTEKWKNIGGTPTLVGLTATSQNVVSGNIVKPKYFYNLATASSSPVTMSGFVLNHAGMESGVSIPNLTMSSAVTKFDDMGYAIETSDLKGNNGNVYNSSIIDNCTGMTLAEVKNARYDEIAYCGFESDYSNPSNYVKGNTSFSSSAVSQSTRFLGRSSYHCSSSSGTLINTTNVLTIGKKYIVSFWVYGAGAITIDDGASTLPNSVNASAPSAVSSYNGWTLYKVTLTAQGTTGIHFSGEGYIDELRVYPANSLMRSYNFLPLIGKIAEVDENEDFTTYEYDSYGNLSIVRDHNGNILSKTTTVTKGY
jgi:YD repeat-containing protein